MARRLLVTRRVVPLDRLEEYRVAWDEVVAAARELGGRAWLFRGSGHEDRFLEFLEWEDERAALPEETPVVNARSALDLDFGVLSSDEWEEAP